MKVGQTSFVVFSSKLIGSALGFIATLYFARELGAEVLGLYALLLTVSNWTILVGEIGIGQATAKRISEGKEQGRYLAATIVWILISIVSLTIMVIVAKPALENYVDGFGDFVSISVVWFVISILGVNLVVSVIFHTLKGERKVHIAGLLEPTRTICRSFLQIVLVVAGYQLLGMLLGYIIAGVLVGLIGLYWVTLRPEFPDKRHFKSLFDYAKFSWLGSLKSRAFNEVDILLLGIFVKPSLVGIYSVAWSIAKFLDLFGSAISTTMFPEISLKSAKEPDQAVASLVTDSLAFTGLIVIPGFIGGSIIGERLMQIYGTEFTQGATVLTILIFAILVYSYLRQLLNALNGIDRPDLAFRVNVFFIILNIGLNILLIPQYHLAGAATASVASISSTLVFAYRTLSNQIDFHTPISIISKQAISGILMGLVVIGAIETIRITNVLPNNVVIVIFTVLLGAVFYFLFLSIISQRFREAIHRNSPFEISHLR